MARNRKAQPWLAAIERRPQADRAGCRICVTAARQGSPRSAFRPCATKSGGSPTCRRLPRPSSSRGGRGPRAAERSSTAAVYGEARAPHRRGERPFRPELSRGALPPGVRVGSLAAAVTEHAGRRPALPRAARRLRHEGFTALNTALAPDGAYIHIPDGVVVERAAASAVFVTAPTGARR